MLLCIFATARVLPQFNSEKLDRGLVVVKNGNNAFLSWRLFGSDPADVKFNVYQGSTLLTTTPLDAAHTNYSVANGASNSYSVAVLVNGAETERTPAVSAFASGSNYLRVPVEKPTGRVWNGSAFETYTAYSIGDGTVADLDGDGQYEVIFFWVPDNLKDNSQSGHTANVFIDAYKLDGTKVWGRGKWIDLGPNIRAGAHYNTFLVYDFDGDGKAEIIVKTADGTKDALGTQIGNNNRYSNADGWVLTGSEFLSVFEGATGKLLASKDFKVARGTVSSWGDNYGNRVDRFLSAVAYLDGVRPSAVMGRGYYARTTMSAWNWDGANLSEVWIFDTNGMSNGSRYTGQGNHSLSVGDVDGDGKDEIIYGSLTINSDGTPRYSTGLGHGDAMHTSMFDPSIDDLLFMGVHEEKEAPGIDVHNLRTGEVLWTVPAPDADVGRGLIADIDPNSDGAEAWSSNGLGVYSVKGSKLGDLGNLNINMATHWGGGTGPRYLFDGNLSRVNVSGNAPNKTFSRTEVNAFSGTGTGGGTKKNPVLQADVFGDWREEIILREADNSAFRIYTTNIATEHTGAGAIPPMGIPTLMHDREYRLAVAWQNSGYNQPPHTGFFIGFNMNTQMPLVAFQSEEKTVSRQQVPNGKTLTRPANPARPGYTFSGWHNGNTAWNFNTGVTNSMILTANWTTDAVSSSSAPSSSSSAPSSSSSVPSSSSSSSLEASSSSSSSDDVSAIRIAANLQIPEGAVVEIFDLKGNKVHKGLGSLPHGVYIVRVNKKTFKIGVLQ